jgi:hypothetical protein
VRQWLPGWSALLQDPTNKGHSSGALAAAEVASSAAAGGERKEAMLLGLLWKPRLQLVRTRAAVCNTGVGWRPGCNSNPPIVNQPDIIQ